jgi:hypothetical protein
MFVIEQWLNYVPRDNIELNKKKNRYMNDSILRIQDFDNQIVQNDRHIYYM